MSYAPSGSNRDIYLMDGWMGGWIDGWMDGWTDGWTDEQTDRQTDVMKTSTLDGSERSASRLFSSTSVVRTSEPVWTTWIGEKSFAPTATEPQLLGRPDFNLIAIPTELPRLTPFNLYGRVQTRN
jgi:hypothetical protein